MTASALTQQIATLREAIEHAHNWLDERATHEVADAERAKQHAALDSLVANITARWADLGAALDARLELEAEIETLRHALDLAHNRRDQWRTDHERLEACERERDSLRLELEAERHNHRRDNEYLTRRLRTVEAADG
jgi:hypothetical protein